MDAGFKSDNVDASTDEPNIRLLVCRTCKSIEELPDWEGGPETDVLLEITVQKHGDSHIGNLLKFPVRYWVVPKVREAILSQIKEGSAGLDVISNNFYATKSQFGEDAMTCWGLHNRPMGQCDDYKSEKKRLMPDTRKERLDAGLDDIKGSGPKVYLCDFCPVKSYNMKMANKEKGLYN
jgi:hypothetical protein